MAWLKFQFSNKSQSARGQVQRAAGWNWKWIRAIQFNLKFCSQVSGQIKITKQKQDCQSGPSPLIAIIRTVTNWQVVSDAMTRAHKRQSWRDSDSLIVNQNSARHRVRRLCQLAHHFPCRRANQFAEPAPMATNWVWNISSSCHALDCRHPISTALPRA